MSAIVGTKQYIVYFDNIYGIIQDGIGSFGCWLRYWFSHGRSYLQQVGKTGFIFIACFWWLIRTIFYQSFIALGTCLLGSAPLRNRFPKPMLIERTDRYLYTSLVQEVRSTHRWLQLERCLCWYY